SEPGFRDYEPGLNADSEAAAAAIRSAAACPPAIAQQVAPPPPDPKTGPFVVDVVLVEPGEWWVGCHKARRPVSAWPGGFLPMKLPESAVSRVYLKMQESLLWSGFKLLPGQTVAELGCSPGGASQVLLEAGLNVIGVDPADMDPMVTVNSRFKHIRKRAKEVSRREFLRVDWLTCDINLPPTYTLDTVEAIVKHPGVRLKGLILTLKLIEWNLADSLPEYLERVRRLGYKQVRARQLHHNRQEVCVVAK
ncbi:MAG: SAM-dependent methyltransferase, partial [Planctomycetota bacterium]|nr:SAM-dependent methyltransferase [Planctomycetota bacterium]